MIWRGLALLLLLGAAPVAAPAEPVRLLAFGDSLTAGYGLAPDEGLVPRLQDWLRRRGHQVEIVNGGVSGDQSGDGRKRIAAWLDHARPDAVMVELGGNDLLGGIAPQVAEGNLDSILTQAGRDDRPLLLVGIAAPEPDAARRRAWAEIWPRLAARHDAVLYPNLYAPFFTLPQSRLGAVLQSDGIHASAEGVRMIVENLGPEVEALLARVEAQHLAVGKTDSQAQK